MNRLYLVLIILWLHGPDLASQTWSLMQKLGSSDQQNNDRLGVSVAVSDSWMLSGAWWQNGASPSNPPLNSAGAVYCYQKQPDGSWAEAQKLVSPHPEILGYFGFSVAMDGERAVVGAYNEDHSNKFNVGRAYIYRLENGLEWVLEDTLTAPDPIDGDLFGIDVAMSGDFVLVGASGQDYDEAGNNFLDEAGAAYLYQRQPAGAWTFLRKLVAFDRVDDDEFGRYLDLDAEGMVIAAYAKDPSFQALSGGVIYAAHCGDTPGCSPEQITSADLVPLVASDPGNFDGFGRNVAISGRWLVAGKAGDDILSGGFTTANVGAAYFFHWENGQWVEKQKVTAPDFSAGAFFGESVDMDGPICVIGAGDEAKDENGANPVIGAGAAYVFERQNGQWQFAQKLVGTNRYFVDSFGGEAVAVRGLNIAVGAWQADSLPGNVLLDAGAVYVFERDEPLSAFQPANRLTGIRLFNNPSSGMLHLVNESGNAFSAVVSVLSVDGRMLLERRMFLERDWQADLSGLPAGLYWVQVRGPGFRPAAWKWVKQ